MRKHGPCQKTNGLPTTLNQAILFLAIGSSSADTEAVLASKGGEGIGEKAVISIDVDFMEVMKKGIVAGGTMINFEGEKGAFNVMRGGGFKRNHGRPPRVSINNQQVVAGKGGAGDTIGRGVGNDVKKKDLARAGGRGDRRGTSFGRADASDPTGGAKAVGLEGGGSVTPNVGFTPG